MTAALLKRWHHVMAQQPKDPCWVDPLPAASPEEIAVAERALGRPFPELLRELQRCSRAWQWREPDYDAVIVFPPIDIARESREPALEAARIQVGVSLGSAAKAYYYSPQRLTFAYSDCHRFQIDDDPGPGGSVGQIVVIDHDEQTIDVAAPSLERFISHGIACLEQQLRGGYPNDA